MCACLLDRVRRVVRTAIHFVRGHLLRLTRPATTTSQVLSVAADLVRSRSDLVAENALLRQQLIILARTRRRPRLLRLDRPLLVLLAGRVRAWRQALLIVQPETMLGWHRAGFRLFWAWRSAPRRRRPGVEPGTIALIDRMARENRLRDLRGVHPAGLTREPAGSVPLHRSVGWSGGRRRHRRSWASVT